MVQKIVIKRIKNYIKTLVLSQFPQFLTSKIQGQKHKKTTTKLALIVSIIIFLLAMVQQKTQSQWISPRKLQQFSLSCQDSAFNCQPSKELHQMGPFQPEL